MCTLSRAFVEPADWIISRNHHHSRQDVSTSASSKLHVNCEGVHDCLAVHKAHRRNVYCDVMRRNSQAAAARQFVRTGARRKIVARVGHVRVVMSGVTTTSGASSGLNGGTVSTSLSSSRTR